MSAVPETATGLSEPTGTEHRDQNEFGWRVLSLTNAFRVLVALLLTGAFMAQTNPRILGDPEPGQFVAWLGALFALAVANGFLIRKRWLSLENQVYIQLVGDLVVVTGLMHAGGGVGSGLGGLLVVTVGSLGLLVPGQRAFLFAAMAALAVLGQQTLSNLAGIASSDQYAPAGILGAVIFVMSAVVSGMGRRMQESESLARQRGVDLANLAELNDYIIQHLRESIVVVDEHNRIRLINESAANHLGSPGTDPGRPLNRVSRDLSEEVDQWRRGLRSTQRAHILSADGGTQINVNFAPIGGDRRGPLLMFLEDTTVLAEKAQKTKLAALGRLSASIAHEIRNPIGAMSHAGQLLAESPAMGDDEHRLTDIIQTNATRVSDIVESVLGLSRRESIRPEDVDLSGWCPDFAAEFTRTLELYEGALEVHAADGETLVRVDPTHLRQVVWNLCDNAVKYASEAAGVIAVELKCGKLPGTGRPFLDIADRGPGIDAARVDEIFEPFYTAGRGGTGLGLFISRELCECNGATLRYLPRPGGGSIFRIVFADPERWQIND